MLQATKDFIGQNWLSTTISILAVFYAVYEARRRRGPLLAYQFTGQRIIGTRRDRLPPGVEISFQGTSLTNLSQTQIIVWNKGDAPLRSSDVPDHDPIVFSFDSGARVFLAEIAHVTRDVNKTEVVYDSGLSEGVTFRFDFLDRNDGALIRVWHDSRDPIPNVSGTLLGQKEGVICYGRFVSPRRPTTPPPRISGFERGVYFVSALTSSRKVVRVLPIAMVFAGLFMAASPFLYPFGLHLTSEPPSTFSKIAGGAIGLFYALTGVMFHSISRRRFPKALLPDDSRSERETEEATAGPAEATMRGHGSELAHD